MYTIAIHTDDQLLMSGRRQSFSAEWEKRLRAMGHRVRIVDYRQRDFFEQLSGCDGFMWWFAHLPYPRNLGRRLLQAIQHGMHMPVFPNWGTVWHFDDKVGQHYLLEAAAIPTPRTWVFWERDPALNFCRNEAAYPIVIKLTGGIVSENVTLLHDAQEAEYWIGRLFRSGVTSFQRPRVRRLADLKGRVVDAARMLLRGHPPPVGQRTDLHHGYVLLQEFLAGNDFDTRVTVIGNRAFAFRRFNRPNDFRASGSGRIDWDPRQIDREAVRLALEVARKLGTQSLAVDVLRRNGEQRVINEISYYYEGWAVEKCPGHWRVPPRTDASGNDRANSDGDAPAPSDLEWIEGNLRPEDAILDDFLATLSARDVMTSDMGPSTRVTVAAI